VPPYGRAVPRRPGPYPALAVGLSVLAAAQSLGEDRGAAFTVAALVGTAGVALARRSPLAVVTLASVSAAAQGLLQPLDPVFGSFLALMVGFFVLGRRGTHRALAVGVALTVVALTVVVVQDPRPFVPVELVFPLVYFGGAFGLGRLARRREQESAAALAASQREADLREQAALAEDRARIAREMHDVVAHSVSLLVVQAESAAAVLPSDPERAATQMERVADSGRQALEELRRLLGVLRTDDPAADTGPQPSLAELPGLVDSVRGAGRDVELDVGTGLDGVPQGLQLTAYRVVQEALTNAVRHGRAQHVSVRVHRCGGELLVDVVDDGTASAPGEPGHGLVGMRERLRLYGGRLDAGPRADGGWQVSARAPLAAS
jgi:signal transduction histidine kinase